ANVRVHMNRRRCFVVHGLCGILLAVGVRFARANKPAEPPPFNLMVGSWIGYGEPGSGTLYRLELYADGRGFLATTSFATPARLYRVQGWTLRANVVDTPLEPADPLAYPLKIHGQAVGGRLNRL